MKIKGTYPREIPHFDLLTQAAQLNDYRRMSRIIRGETERPGAGTSRGRVEVYAYVHALPIAEDERARSTADGEGS